MQTEAKTPTRLTALKKVHTPPSMDRHGGDRPKLAKTFSGNLFKRSVESPNLHKSSPGLNGYFVPAPSSFGERSTPKPLNLSPMTPPPSLRKVSTTSTSTCASSINTVYQSARSICQLNSPIRLTPSKQIKVLETPFSSSVDIGHRNGLSACSVKEELIIWTETADDPYLEEGSPTYLCEVSQNISKLNSNTGHRRFVKCNCALCDEHMSSVLCGEKIIEMTCRHACHYECYLAVLEPSYFDKRYPCCRICGKIVKPADGEILHEMISKILTKKRMDDEPNYVVEPQSIYSGLLVGTNNQVTPIDQLIRSADVSSNGFKIPFFSNSPDSNHCEDDDMYEEFDITFSNLLVGEAALKNACSDPSYNTTESSNSRHCKMDAKVTHKQQDPRVEIIETSHCGISSYSMAVSTLADDVQIELSSGNMIEGDTRGIETKSWREKIEFSIKQEVDPEYEYGSIILFDEVNYSTDGEQWIDNIMAYLFSDTLVLFDHDERYTVGKIPKEQIHQVVSLEENILLLELKSRNIPEIYLSFSSMEDEQNLAGKWKYFISRRLDIPSLSQITSSSWTILPFDLQHELKEYLTASKLDVSCGALLEPWKRNASKVPLQLIVCANISGHELAEQRIIVNELKRLVENLDDDDLFGLVTVGIDGKGNIGEYGTYTGTISKTWGYWDDILDCMELTSTKVFHSNKSELEKMLETCSRLVSTSATMIMEAEQSRYLKQVILIRDGDDMDYNSSKLNLIKDRHNFDVLQVPLPLKIECDEDDKNVFEDRNYGILGVISTLRRKVIKDLTVRVGRNEVQFGNMQRGERKIVPLDSSMAKDLGLRQNSEIEVAWFDRITQKEHHSYSVAKLVEKTLPRTTSEEDASFPTKPREASYFLGKVQVDYSSGRYKTGYNQAIPGCAP